MILVLGIWAFVRASSATQPPSRNVVLRHQLAVLQRSVGRPRLRLRDRLFWVAPSQLWAGWRARRLIVQPATVLQLRERHPEEWVPEAEPDRKSTRLNSSHSQNAYAGLCL